jgi:alpha-amylase
VNWWGVDWIRAGFPFHQSPGNDDLTMSLAFLPDLITEAEEAVDPPPLFANKPNTNVEAIPNASVRDYLVDWHTRWVRDFGIDGFRCDTAKHVEFGSWTALKNEAVAALDAWKAANPDQALDDLDFWMVGEAFPPLNDPDFAYFDAGFDALINFELEGEPGRILDFERMESLYASLADQLARQDGGYLTFASNHDTDMFFEQTDRSIEDQFTLAAGLLMLPGAAQIYYGDESAREAGPPTSDGTTELRSDMNWDQITGERQALVEHWQKIGQFRRDHRAVGAGEHAELTTEGDPAYAFSRVYDGDEVDDEVVVVLGE